MILRRLTHLVTLSLKPERRGETQPPLDSLGYRPLSPCSQGGREKYPEQELPGCCLPPERAHWQLAKFLVCAPDSSSASWDAPSCLLLPTEPRERGLLPLRQLPPSITLLQAAMPMEWGKAICFREGNKAVFEEKPEFRRDGKEMRKGKKSLI